MNYLEIHPVDQNDLSAKIKTVFGSSGYSGLSSITLINSGMGSGKSNIMADLPFALKGFHGITIVLEKNQHLQTQIRKSFNKSASVDKICLIDIDEANVEYKIREGRLRGSRPVVFLNNVGHKSGKHLKTVVLLIKLLKSFSSVDKLALIDENDNQLTSLTGGVNSKLDHPAGIMTTEYAGVLGQDDSLNIYDILREYSVKCIGLSGTMNNMICSKLPSLGYNAKDICIINVYPIKSLYENLQIIPMDVNNFSAIMPYLIDAEKMENKKILIAVPERKRIPEFKRNYSKNLGQPISSVTIDGTNEKERTTDKWKDEFKNAKYVFGINIITTGFDLSTWVEGQEFSLGILYRRLSDKISQPLSKNDEHVLHMDTAASLMQLLARLRKGGLFLIPSKLDGRSLYDRLVEVFNCIKNGLNEYDWLGGGAAIRQVERYHQGLQIALIQNIREGNRPIVDGILSDLKSLTEREFEIEMKANLDSRSSLDHVFWTGWIGCLWMTYLVEHEASLSAEAKQVKKAQIIANHRRGISIKGGGLRSERIENEMIIEEVKKRANNRCGHCGRTFYEGYIPQICHMRRNDDEGAATLENLFYGHSGCDATFDNDREILYDASNGVWLRGNAVNYNPDPRQLSEMSVENLIDRWNWEKEQQGKGHLSHLEFIEYLKNSGYIYKKYA